MIEEIKVGELLPRDNECPCYSVGDSVVINDRRNTKKVLTIVRGTSWSNNHFMLMEQKGLTEILHPFSWRQFRRATPTEIEVGERLYGVTVTERVIK